MEHTYIEEHHIVDRYVMDRLPEADKEQFEEHYLGCQDCLDRLEVAERMQGGFKRAGAEDAAQVVVAQQLSVVAWLARLGRGRQLAVLAMAALAVVALPSAFLVPGLTGSGEAPETDVELFFLSPERSAATGEPSVRIRLGAGPIVLALELDRPASEGYSAALLSAGGSQELWRGEGLTPNHLNALTVSFPPDFFEPGDYLLRVEDLGVEDEVASPVAEFSFRILPRTR